MFLVLTATFRESTFLRLALPEAQTGERRAAGAPDRLTVIIDATGDIRVGGERVSLEELGTLLGAMAGTGTQVVLAADSRASHGRVVSVMDRARRAGIHYLDIETIEGDAR